MVQFLLSRGANPNANLLAHIDSALEVAASSASITVIDALLDAGAALKGRSALCEAAGEGRADVVAHLLDRGAAIDEIPENSDILEVQRAQGLKNALGVAALEGSLEVVKLLLERGADVKVKDSKGRSALQLAEAEKHEAVAEILRRHAEASAEA
jgi:ankyrin repeat protein